jgi:hypothetical protein
VVLVAVVVFAMRAFYMNSQAASPTETDFTEAVESTSVLKVTPEEENGEEASENVDVDMPSFEPADEFAGGGVLRSMTIHTSIPTRPRTEVITYSVEQGDSVFGIAEKFSLKPETILWGNYNTLADNPHALKPGQDLNILPTNGTYHEWKKGESLTKVADYYGVDPMDIVEYPGNDFDIYDFDIENPDIEPGAMLIVPGGQREMVDYGPPTITRQNPAVASTYGPGHCGTIMEGAVGAGVFIWPTTERWISGYDYNPGANHPAIDIAGQTGNSVWSVDNGVIVYAGWSNYGYGNLVVVDHGNGWQSLYAHLSGISVGCGQSVYQGNPVGQLGSTGNSTGAHLHFELIYMGQRVNPWNFLQ